MPTELLKEFIGKECIISLTNEKKDQIRGIIFLHHSPSFKYNFISYKLERR